MSNHLSEDQFARCIAGGTSIEDLQHILECPECNAELERFGNTLSLLRNAILDRIDDHVASHTSETIPFSNRPVETGIANWRWALGAAAVVVFVLTVRPFFMTESETQEVREQTSTEANPNAIMDAVNRHLSRTVPAPMEPVLSLIPGNAAMTEPGGVQ
jgi:hypothetical protein